MLSVLKVSSNAPTFVRFVEPRKIAPNLTSNFQVIDNFLWRSKVIKFHQNLTTSRAP